MVKFTPAYTQTYWVTLAHGKSVCVVAESLAEIVEAVKPGIVVEIKSLPYPAMPRAGKLSECPPFCTIPNTCAGHTSCPARPSCSE